MGDSGVVIDDAHRFGAASPEEEFVYGACSPGWHSAGSHATAIDDWIDFMHESGIERVCCLLTGRQLDQQEANVGRYRDAFGRENVLHAPIPDHHLAEPDYLSERILPFLEESVQKEEPVVVHCLAGIGRTGQVLAAWLVTYREYSPEAAVSMVQKMGRDPMEATRHGNAAEEDVYSLLASL